MSIREKILNAQDLKSERVTVDVWGVEVEVRGLTAAQRADVMAAARDENGALDDARIIVPIVIAATFDPETKQPVFTKPDLEALGGKNAEAVDKLAAVALRLSGISSAAVEAIEKN